MDCEFKVTLAEANALDAKAFADIAEHSAWVSEVAFQHAPFENRDAMIAQFSEAVMQAPRHLQLELLNAHPDLANRAKLTVDSTNEQASAGLDRLTADEFTYFTHLNTRYKLKNGFPFILAVKVATKHDILAGFELRLLNTSEVEFQTALTEVCKIIRFRLEERVSS